MKNTNLIRNAEEKLTNSYKTLEDIALFNQNKVLNALKDNHLALRHFANTSGYGYDDAGRDTLNKVYAQIFCCDLAIVSPNIVSGTHALTIGLFATLRPGDTFVSISGIYDTLNDVISGNNIGSLADFNIKHINIPLSENSIDFNKLAYAIDNDKSIKMVFIQRSRGYSWRNALSIDEIEFAIKFIKKINPNLIVIVDNCYGEFVDKREPTEVGADLVIGSLIKNIGGGIAPSGGYLAGKSSLVEQCGFRLTAPSIGTEVGSYMSGYQYFYQGLFLAPHVVLQSLKTCLLFSEALSQLGYETLPKSHQIPNDIICSIKFGNKDKLISFCQEIQRSSPVDSFATPYPWDMPGYADQVIMAAGCFVQGASIELSCDSPITEPYIAYLQGALTYEHGKIALDNCLSRLMELSSSN